MFALLKCSIQPQKCWQGILLPMADSGVQDVLCHMYNHTHGGIRCNPFLQVSWLMELYKIFNLLSMLSERRRKYPQATTLYKDANRSTIYHARAYTRYTCMCLLLWGRLLQGDSPIAKQKRTLSEHKTARIYTYKVCEIWTYMTESTMADPLSFESVSESWSSSSSIQLDTFDCQEARLPLAPPFDTPPPFIAITVLTVVAP